MPGNPPVVEPDLVTLERNSFNFLEYGRQQLMVDAMLTVILLGT